MFIDKQGAVYTDGNAAYVLQFTQGVDNGCTGKFFPDTVEFPVLSGKLQTDRIFLN